VIQDCGERGGAASVEAGIVAVGIALLLLFALAAGRYTAAESATTEAARAAARLGSAQRDPALGRTVATAEARRVLAEHGLSCASLTVTVDVPAVPVGVASVATARVHCAVRWSDLGLPGTPGTKDVAAEFTSAVDRYRER
jgi:Flp pilus assembly protein TadG